MKIGSRSGTAAVTVMVPNSLGPAELLLHYGTDEQKIIIFLVWQRGWKYHALHSPDLMPAQMPGLYLIKALYAEVNLKVKKMFWVYALHGKNAILL